MQSEVGDGAARFRYELNNLEYDRMKMDRETLNEMVKLKFGSRKAGGPEIDLVKLAADAVYADQMFSAAENLHDETLVLLAITLRDKFGLLAARPQGPANHPPAVVETVEVPQSRYMSGARS
ncbi:MAG: hypothetical protein Q8K52_07540 [Thiobacillus sp.]|nr:hypothetical protein [Thiobacillus sp.]